MIADLVDSLVAGEPASRPVLRLFDDPKISYGRDRRDVPDGCKRLLVFLALHRRRVDRRYAAGILWPDGTDDRAAGNLRSALWRLNRAYQDLVRVDRHGLAFGPDVLVDIDLVAEWAKRVISGRLAHSDLRVVPTGNEAFDLLPGWYDDWVLVERERIRQRVLHAMEAMSRHLVAAGRCAEAVEVALLATSADPLRESAQIVLLEAHLAEGNWVEARRGLDAYRGLLAREFGIEPGTRLRALLDAYPNARVTRPAGPAPAGSTPRVAPTAAR
ncbi:BTAD domain-containing putative transcriptional regulator [Micromonospora sp. NPDC005806]|uniref:AfsR/SARP family transcriptional regulator n=1 Tax=Micromonospora sp. NPDC005806 TaxID=3364234 RepID=UPI0036A6D079